MKQEYFEIGGRRCTVYTNRDFTGPTLYWGVSSEDRQETEETAFLLSKHMPDAAWTLAAFEVKDWNTSFSPWEAPAVFRGQPFSGQAKDTLDWLTRLCMPKIEETYPVERNLSMIGGYSLAGLFSLWAFYESGFFRAAAGCSASLWYPGWDAYVRTKTAPLDSIVYLSLGETEEKTKNHTMASVGDRVREQYARLSHDPAVRRTTLVWHPGGHFSDVQQRIVHGFIWLLRNMPRAGFLENVSDEV